MQILNYIEEKRSFYDNETIQVPGNEQYSQSQLINSINCTHLAKYVDDNAKDDIIGDYPYDNISKYRIRLEARATDFDVKGIEVEPLNGSREARVSTMIATKALAKKMRDISFGTTLNKITDTLPEYGGVLVKRTEDGVHVVPWENVITDMSDIMGGVIIERHYYTPSQLKKKGWKDVDMVIRTAAEKKKEKDMKRQAGEDVETITEMIEVWELHGEVPMSVYKQAEADFEDKEYKEGDDDDINFVQCQIIVAPEGKDENDEMQGLILQANEEAEMPYKFKARNPLAGRGLGEGIPEELGEHQRWHNFFKTEEARAVAIGGKVMFITDDWEVPESIYDDGIGHGSILKKSPNSEFAQLSTLPSSVPLYKDIREEWSTSGDNLTNSYAVALGSQEFADTPYRAQFLQDVNSNSQFKQYYEEISDELINPIVTDWLLPEALDDAAKDDEIFETFSKAELQLIDDVIIAEAQTSHLENAVFNERRPVTPEEMEELGLQTKNDLAKKGTKRSIKGIKKFIKDAAGKVVIHSSDEQRSKRALFESYSNALALFAENDPARLAMRDRILDQMGVTPEELSLYVEEAQMMAAQATPANPELEDEQLVAEETKTKIPANV